MNRNPRNDENESVQNVHGLRKITYMEKYGVKMFPYSGQRRYTPSVYQSEDGGIVISNDVFGLTIMQFERVYQACLDKRKAQKQYILNLRYPDKASDEYLEYLEICTDFNKDYMSGNDNDSKERYLYTNLVNTVGTEIDIRKRQQLFIVRDMIDNAAVSNITSISSGSLAEGFNLPGSDIDNMNVIRNVDVIQDVRYIKRPLQNTTLVMETDDDHPGFCRLRLIERKDGKYSIITNKCFERTRTGSYLSVNLFMNSLNQMFPELQLSTHGPCLSDQKHDLDSATCLHSKYLPFRAMPWASRHRQQWPPNSIIDKIIENGCLLVSIGPRDMSDCNVLWRISFSVAEKLLVHSFNYTQLLCYGLLKLTLKHRVNIHKHVEGLLCSYFMKTALFWVSEEEDIDTFQLSKLFYCFTKCIEKLIEWVNNCFCPNYFIPEHNMFKGKLRPGNNRMLLNVLDTIKIDKIDGLIRNAYSQDIEKYRLFSTRKNSSVFMLDLLVYRIYHLTAMTDMPRCFKALMLTKSLINSKSSIFINDVCKYFYAEMSQNAAQSLPTPNVTAERYNIHKRYHRHLQDGTNTDAVSGWLFYASFYYVTGQFKVVLRLIDYVLSRCTPDMLLVGCGNHNEEHIKNYTNHVHSTMTLNDKIRVATVRLVIYLQNSSLIPGELQLEVKDQDMCLHPIVMSHCLRFLCYHHLDDIFNRKKALSDLYLTVKHRNYIISDLLSYSKTILGVCYEISGDKDAAYQCFDEALKCDGILCLSAKTRKSMLCSSSKARKSKLLGV